jgi:hypothetical protein
MDGFSKIILIYPIILAYIFLKGTVERWEESGIMNSKKYWG